MKSINKKIAKTLVLMTVCWSSFSYGTKDLGIEGINFSKQNVNYYLNGTCGDVGLTSHCALAISPNGHFVSAENAFLDKAKSTALSKCKYLSEPPVECKIVDEDGKSAFIAKLKGRDSISVSQSSGGERQLVGTGTGFTVNNDYVVTAAHVVDECNTVSIRHKHKEMHGQVVAIDSNNDLGLIKLDEKFTASGRLRDGNPINLGGMVANYGYPLFGQLSDAAKVTQGNINALAGWENDSSIFQFDAPTQPGNSGGPLLDNSGNIVALVSSGLSKDYAINSDHIAQNVNFAVKSYLIEGFLTANGVTYEKAESTELLELPDIAEKAETFTVLVGCWE